MAQIDDLPPLRDVIKKYDLWPKKNLGQNFLFDLNLTSRIARAGGALAGKTVVEVGPGPGGLTRALLAEGAELVIAVERDIRCLPALNDIAACYPGRLIIVHEDAMNFDPSPLLEGKKARIISNLPYNIGTNLLVHWLMLEPWPSWWDSQILMFQREVAERIVATPQDSKNYGRLSVLAGIRCETRLLFDIPPAAFVPPPKVISSVVALRPHDILRECTISMLEKVTRLAFGQRRKMLRQSLRTLDHDILSILQGLHIEETKRAEELSVNDYLRISNALTKRV